MADPIRPMDIDARRMNIAPVRPPSLRPGQAATAGKSFQDTLAETISEVRRLQNSADDTVRKLVSGEIKDVTEAIVAVQEADLAFQTMMTVRNRVMTAYEEIMRMQV